jgi:hypothetical protein
LERQPLNPITQYFLFERNLKAHFNFLTLNFVSNAVKSA